MGKFGSNPTTKVDYYEARCVATQVNVAGGAIIIDITPPTGGGLEILELFFANSGTNTIVVRKTDEDNANGIQLYSLSSAAAVYGSLPTPGGATGSGNISNSQRLKILPSQKLTISQTAAGAQNDTLTVGIVAKRIGQRGDPTWSKARSTNQADVTIAASTISDDNPQLIEVRA